MLKSMSNSFAGAALSLTLAACGHVHTAAPPSLEVKTVRLSTDISLRTLSAAPLRPKGTVLLLHGFPETMYAFKPVAEALSAEYEVHAFDWPGYGQSSRPSPDRFSYSPMDYAHVLRDYIRAARIDTSNLVIYATDIGALPALLAALEQPDIAKHIIVGDFAPFNRPQYMYESLQNLKSAPSAGPTHAAMNRGRDEILENAFRRGLPKEEQFELTPEYKEDLAAGWRPGTFTPADAFYHYYASFTRDQDYFEANIARLAAPLTVVWGEKDIYIKKEMGLELAQRQKLKFTPLPGIGHYPHLQAPAQAVAEIRAAFGR
jgi:pimeloyl-ACP methyl ester carboxylesterase